MGILSSAVSINRYRVAGELKGPVLDAVTRGLRDNVIVEMDDLTEKAVGWTSFQSPFDPQFGGSSFVMEPYFMFSMRIDRKVVPPKVFKKHLAIESAQYLLKSGRKFLTRDEKEMIKEKVLAELRSRIPPTPEVYDLIWNYEDRRVWFFTLLKAANEELESLFAESFSLTIIRLFPYTIADLTADLSAEERDVLYKISPTSFAE